MRRILSEERIEIVAGAELAKVNGAIADDYEKLAARAARLIGRHAHAELLLAFCASIGFKPGDFMTTDERSEPRGFVTE